MIILSIETSCDDTCAAILEIQNSCFRALDFNKQINKQAIKIQSNIISSQEKLHKKYGGVYPFLAKREHQKNLPIVFKKAIKKANNPKIDFIAVTIGPGLEPCLWTGINFAKDLAKKLNLPIIPINHVEAHIFANLLPQIREKPKTKNQKPKTQIKNKKIDFPAICLVVSGGHTQLILMEDFGKYKILGETRDDAAGECFDKTARILGLEYPGGPAIAAEAAKFLSSRFGSQRANQQTSKISLPRPMIFQKNYDFSFSGLKTAVLYNYKNQKPKFRKSKRYIQAMCYEIQQAIIDVLILKTLKAAKEHKAKTIILGGGVAANSELRKHFKIQSSAAKINLFAPAKKLCVDNALMIGLTAGYCLKEKRRFQKNIKAQANLRLN